MAIIAQYVAFRHWFAEVARTQGVSLTYDHVSSPNTISRASGSFVTDGYEEGMTLQVIGTPDNDGGAYEVGAVSALTLSLVTGQNFTSSYTDTSSLVGAFYELDGMEEWPTDLVRANGFDGGFAASVLPFSPFPLTLTVNDGVTDATAGTSYTWYLSQRTDDATKQHLTMTHANTATTGTVTLALTSTAVADLGLASTTSSLNAGQRVKLLRNVFVYCQRQSDKAIQLAHLLTLSDAQPV
jgi:hypothetical protein